jgi:hypothetical protein
MSQRQGSAWAAGWISFAGFMMILLGSFHAVAGLVGIFDDTFYTKTANYIFQFDRSTWGWIHLIVGIIIVLAGFGVFSGAVWARTIGVIMAIVSGIAAFAWLPWYPIWGIAIIVCAIAVIWALTLHGREVEKLQE